ncbi:MAG: hypothetical protein EXR69_11965 [Myxococcales bacterium]|nr:hypothetical protein [Myxococcales bacterium]
MNDEVAGGRGWLLTLGVSLVVILGAGFALLVDGPAPAPQSELSRALGAVGASIDVPATVSTLNVQEAGGSLQSILAADGAARLRIRVTEGLDRDAAAKRVKDVRSMIDGLFEPRQAPYPGELSHTLQCPEEYQPMDVVERGDALALLQLYANDRLTFGGCSADLLRYHTTVGYFYSAGSRRLFGVEYFAIVGGDDNGLRVVQSFQTAPEAR